MKTKLLTAAAAVALGLCGAGAAHAQGAAYGDPVLRTEARPAETSVMPVQWDGRRPGAYNSRREVRMAQQRLHGAGLYRGAIDGRMGPGTRRAIARFQRMQGLPPTAHLDWRTRSALLGGPPAGYGSSMPPRPPHHWR